jgi:hypothetical protein
MRFLISAVVIVLLERIRRENILFFPAPANVEKRR